MTEPAGISTRLPSYMSTTVVAWNRSSTCAVSDESSRSRRTSISRPSSSLCVRPIDPLWVSELLEDDEDDDDGDEDDGEDDDEEEDDEVSARLPCDELDRS